MHAKWNPDFAVIPGIEKMGEIVHDFIYKHFYTGVPSLYPCQ